MYLFYRCPRTIISLLCWTFSLARNKTTVYNVNRFIRPILIHNITDLPNYADPNFLSHEMQHYYILYLYRYLLYLYDKIYIHIYNIQFSIQILPYYNMPIEIYCARQIFVVCFFKNKIMISFPNNVEWLNKRINETLRYYAAVWAAIR